MSAVAMAWVWRQVEVTGNDKVALLALADSANDHGLVVGEEGQREWAGKLGVAENTVRAVFRRLEDSELLVRQPQYGTTGGRLADVLRLPVGASTSSGSPPATSSGSPPQHSAASARADERASELPTTNRASARKLPAWPLSVEIPEETVEEAEAFLAQKRKVAGRVITPEEMLNAAAAMAEFNRQAGTNQGLASSLESIVGRLRDRPSWDVERVVRLVQSAFVVRWWDRPRPGDSRTTSPRRLTPAPIFGNARCFEMVVQDAQDLANGREAQVEARRGKYDRSVVRDA